MESLYNDNEIIAALEREICPIHHQHPKVISLHDFRIEYCCREFIDYLTQMCDVLMDYQANQYFKSKIQEAKIQSGLQEE